VFADALPSEPGASPDATATPASNVDEVYRRCRHLGMRLSRQRRMVLELLWDEKDHLSARDIFEKLNTRGRTSATPRCTRTSKPSRARV